ncbi:hypothetical protein A2U01_0079032 [Trifolium medium]|uniref:Uncharacterized protein n=1 Tax=Trifolium medium TaxID=97028 RepID=A0A392T9L4_9FABA|nr:hypothetical protein [Trifolium medium]
MRINQVQTVLNHTAKGSNDMVQKLASRIYRFLDRVVPSFHSTLHCFEAPTKNRGGTRSDSAKGG